MRFVICRMSGRAFGRLNVTKAYHVRVHYRTASKATARKVAWFSNIEAANKKDAGKRAIERITSRKANAGIVEVEMVDVRQRS